MTTDERNREEAGLCEESNPAGAAVPGGAGCVRDYAVPLLRHVLHRAEEPGGDFQPPRHHPAGPRAVVQLH